MRRGMRCGGCGARDAAGGMRGAGVGAGVRVQVGGVGEGRGRGAATRTSTRVVTRVPRAR